MSLTLQNPDVKKVGATIRYYGGKSKLVEFINDSLLKSGIKAGASILDGFTGTSVVAQSFKRAGFETTANDHLYFSYVLADAHLHFNVEPKFKALGGLATVLNLLNTINGETDFITKNYSPHNNCERMYFSKTNAQKIDAIRNLIKEWEDEKLITIHEKNYLIASLIHAINLVSNITGTYGAYLKFWESRSTKKLMLQALPITNSNFKNKSLNMDVYQIINNSYDFVYLDPPYNSRNYFANYFLLEIIARGWHNFEFKPAGITGKPNNFELKSDFNSKNKVEGAFHKLLANCNSENIAISYNNEGVLALDRLLEICDLYGRVRTFTFEHKRYRSVNQTGDVTSTTEVLLNVRKK